MFFRVLTGIYNTGYCESSALFKNVPGTFLNATHQVKAIAIGVSEVNPWVNRSITPLLFTLHVFLTNLSEFYVKYLLPYTHHFYIKECFVLSRLISGRCNHHSLEEAGLNQSNTNSLFLCLITITRAIICTIVSTVVMAATTSAVSSLRSSPFITISAAVGTAACGLSCLFGCSRSYWIKPLDDTTGKNNNLPS